MTNAPPLEPSPPVAAPQAPAWYPAWAKELADLYFSGAVCMFVLHGNVHDLVGCPDGEGDKYITLTEFLAQQIFGRWELVLGHDLGAGLRLLPGGDSARLQKMVQTISPMIGNPATWPRDADKTLAVVEQLFQRNLLEASAADRKSVSVIFQYAQYLVPAADLNYLAGGHASRLVRLMGWAQNPYIKRVNMAICLTADRLSEINPRLVQNPHVAAIEIPLPDHDTRRRFIQSSVRGTNESEESSDNSRQTALGEMTVDSLTQLSSGLNLVNLNVVLSRGRGTGSGKQGLGQKQFRRLKKSAIERQCQGLVTFVEPSHTLELVVGHTAAKDRLRQDAQWIAEGRLDTAPMGYLLCGPVGTGKTFLAECYAGTIGIPCLKLGNFRSKYVGETEGNLQQVLTVLRSLGPVVVIIDEADAALGDRRADGDSGVAGRVFSMIATQMGDTQYRGYIIWMLLTARPDLLPIDLKRQGRAEVHIPLFYPQGASEVAEMFKVMARKNGVAMEEGVGFSHAPDTTSPTPPDLTTDLKLSGADIESVVLHARRMALSNGRAAVSQKDLDAAMAAFIPSAQGLEKEMQELAAVLECTDRAFLPPEWIDRISPPDGRTRLQERLVAIRQLTEEL